MTLPSTQPSPQSAPRKKKSRTGLYLTLAVVLVVVLAVAASLKNKGRETGTLVTVEPAVRKTITELVSATGKIQPEVEVKIAPEVAGEIVEMPLREGDPVKKGDLLVRIKDDNYRFQVDQQMASLAATRASSLESKVQLAKAAEDLRRNEELATKHLISDSELLAARTLFEAAQAAFDSSLAQIRRAEGTLKQAEDQLAKTVIYSPMDGTVSSRSSEVGERVAGTGQYGGAEIMRVADLSSMEVRVLVNENDIVNVKVRDQARISIDAFPDREFGGEIKEIAIAAKTTGQSTQEEVTNFQVKVRITDNEPAIRPGMSASVDIETQTVEDIIAVPIQAVTVRTREDSKTIDQQRADREKKEREMRGDTEAEVVNPREQRERERADRDALQRVVFVRHDNVVKMVPVETGVADTTHMEIKSGIEVGDEVVTGSYNVITRVLKDDMKIRVEKPKTDKDKKKNGEDKPAESGPSS